MLPKKVSKRLLPIFACFFTICVIIFIRDMQYYFNLKEKTQNLLSNYGNDIIFTNLKISPSNEETISTTFNPETDSSKNISIGSFNDITCYEKKNTHESLELFDARGVDEKSIFFHETSCFGQSETVLDARQACAVESAAKMNPKMMVYLLVLSPTKLSKSTKSLYDRLIQYKNVRVKRVIINEYIKNTPLEGWFSVEMLKNTSWPIIQMADIIRYVTLWKFGGIYLDLDVISMKSMEDLTDFAGAQSEWFVAIGAMGFSKSTVGRQVANNCLLELMQNFRGDIWGHNGPRLITEVLKSVCNVNSITNMTLGNCHGFKVLNPSAFYPIHYSHWIDYFSTEKLEENMNLIKHSIGIHVWNKLSKSQKIDKRQSIPYMIVAKDYCPLIYTNPNENF